MLSFYLTRMVTTQFYYFPYQRHFSLTEFFEFLNKLPRKAVLASNLNMGTYEINIFNIELN